MVGPGQIAIWQTPYGFPNLASGDRRNFTNTDSPAKRLSRSMLRPATLGAEPFLLQIREYFA
jgi:hypothetical protein